MADRESTAGCRHCGRPNPKYARCCATCYTRGRRKAMALRKWDNNRTTDLGPALEHLAALRAAGFSKAQIARLGGFGLRWIQQLDKPGHVWVESRKVASLLAIPLPMPAEMPDIVLPGRYVDGTGTRRRLQALSAIGYTQRDIIGRLGMAPTVTYILWQPFGRRPGQDRRGVLAKTAQKVSALYDEIAMTPPPATRWTRGTIRRAARDGWAPPLAWDEHTIDDPAAVPAPWQRPDTAARTDWLDELVDRRALGRTDEVIAASFGISVESMYRRLNRAGLPYDYGRPA